MGPERRGGAPPARARKGRGAGRGPVGGAAPLRAGARPPGGGPARPPALGDLSVDGHGAEGDGGERRREGPVSSGARRGRAGGVDRGPRERAELSRRDG